MPSNLGPTNISETFNGLLHAFGAPLPLNSTQALIYDGYGTPSALRLGSNCNGATICGVLSCDSIVSNTINTGSHVFIGDDLLTFVRSWGTVGSPTTAPFNRRDITD